MTFVIAVVPVNRCLGLAHPYGLFHESSTSVWLPVYHFYFLPVYEMVVGGYVVCEGGLWGRTVRADCEGGLWGRSVRAVCEGGLWGRSVRADCEGGLWGRTVRADCEGGLWGRSVRADCEGGLWGRTVRADCEGGLWGRTVRAVCEGGLWGRTVRADCEGGLWGWTSSLLVYCSFCAFSTSFLCSFGLVLSNLPVSPMYAVPQLLHVVW